MLPYKKDTKLKIYEQRKENGETFVDTEELRKPNAVLQAKLKIQYGPPKCHQISQSEGDAKLDRIEENKH